MVEHRIRNARVAGSNPAFGSTKTCPSMSETHVEDNAPPRRSRARQREAMTNAVATVLGCMALVIMIATVVRVVMVKLWDSTSVNPEYVQWVYDTQAERRRSDNVTRQPELDLATAVEASSSTSIPVATGRSDDLQTRPAIASTQASSQEPVSARLTEGPQAGLSDIESKRQVIESTVRGFFDAVTIEEKLRFVRDPQRVQALMTNHYGNHPLERHEWRSLGWLLPVQEPGFRLGYAQAIFADSEPVSLIIEEMQDGEIKVDWESSVRYGELDWNEFIQTRPTSPKLFRVIASKPAVSPSDNTPPGTQVLEIKHPDQDHVIYAYFDPEDPKFQPLIEQLQNGHWKDVPLTLRLCYPGPLSSVDGARIAEVEGKGWLILQGTRS